MKPGRLRIIGLLAAAMLLFLTSSAWAVSVTVEWPTGQDRPPVVGPPGPPPHAPAHGYRRQSAYRYYPDSQVYFDTARGIYFFLDGGHWRSGSSLPGFLGGALGAFVTIQADHDRPYREIDVHRGKYPPGQMKHKERGWEKHKGRGWEKGKEKGWEKNEDKGGKGHKR